MNYPIDLAREHKAHRAKALAALREGRLSLREVLRDRPDALLGVDIYGILLATKGIGEKTAQSILMRSVVWPYVKLCKLSKVDQNRILRNLPQRIK